MNCPICSIPLREIKAQDLVVDLCPKCRGIWFDRGEFAVFLRELTESETISPRTPQLFSPRKQNLSSPQMLEVGLSCPRCQNSMQKLNYATDSDVFLDKCEQCGGLWTERGEASKIARYLKLDPKIIEIFRQRFGPKPALGLLDGLDELAKNLGSDLPLE